MTTTENSLGERIANCRRRRGLSQTVLAGLIGRSVSWLSQVERGERSVDKLSVLVPLAKALRVDLSSLVGEELEFSRMDGPGLRAVDAIRAAMTTYVYELDSDQDLPDLITLESVLIEINTLYQAGQYDRAGSLLPLAIRGAEIAVNVADNEHQDQALEVQSRTQQTTAALLSRVGQTDLGWVAADRSITAARRANSPELIAAGIYRLGQIMLRAGRYEEAFRLADSTMSTIEAPGTPARLSLHGALLLTAAIAAAKMTDRRESTRLITQAQRIADQLGAERNDHWTAFGHSNVRIHASSAAVDLGDPDDVLTHAAAIDPSAIPPELGGRRSQLHIDMAWAYGQHRNDAAAVLALIEAERLAPQAVHHSPVARDLIQNCLRRARRKGALPGLDGLAQRVGVLV